VTDIDLIVTGGLIVEPEVGIIRADIVCSKGVIAALATPGTVTNAEETIRADGLYVLPGLFDPHTHAGIYQSLDSDALTETQAALSGGATTVGVFLHTGGSYEDVLPEIIRTFNERAVVDVKLHVTVDSELHLKELEMLSRRFGIDSFKFYLAGIAGVLEPVDDATLLRGFQAVASLPGTNLACVHAENQSLVEHETRRVRETITAPNLWEWESTRPGFAEAEAISRACYLASLAGCRLYLVHVSSAAGATILAQSKPPLGLAETTSSYLTCAIEDFEPGDLWAKHLPPIRRRHELDELWAAVADGRIDTIGTDHIAITRKAKTAAGTILDMITAGPSIDTHLPAILTEGYIRRGIPLQRLVGMVTSGPAKAFGLYPRKGSLLPGADADLAIIDLDTERAVRAEALPGSSDFSLWEGRKMRGWPVTVVKGGKVAYSKSEVQVDPGNGSVLSNTV
jgi:dihydroorotase-like cyclic amidohydrolase